MSSRPNLGPTAPKATLQVKVCGVTSPTELQLLDEEGADYAGIWLGFSDPSRPSAQGFAELAATPVRRVRCIAVLMSVSDLAQDVEMIRRSGVVAAQMHGFQLPAAVATLRRQLPSHVELIKVLHFQRGTCLERPLLEQYAKVGVDAFLIDSFESQERAGSTGQPVPRPAILELLNRVDPARMFVAGGIQPEALPWLQAQGVRGIDVDTGVRTNAVLQRSKLRALVAAAGKGEHVRS
jgi:phosphoribosylanthranilate isomerase